MDIFIAVKEAITVTGTVDTNKRDKRLAFKNNIPFKSFISKINNAFVDKAEDLDFVMPIYSQLEYSDS